MVAKACPGRVLFALIFCPIEIALQALAITVLWFWFVVPLGVDPIGAAHAIGISMFLRFLTQRTDVDLRLSKQVTWKTFEDLSFGGLGGTRLYGVVAMGKVIDLAEYRLNREMAELKKQVAPIEDWKAEFSDEDAQEIRDSLSHFIGPAAETFKALIEGKSRLVTFGQSQVAEQRRKASRMKLHTVEECPCPVCTGARVHREIFAGIDFAKGPTVTLFHTKTDEDEGA